VSWLDKVKRSADAVRFLKTAKGMEAEWGVSRIDSTALAKDGEKRGESLARHGRRVCYTPPYNLLLLFKKY
jgi:hypothetical protein